MITGFIKATATLIVSTMTFLGWNISEYIFVLPPPIQHEIQIAHGEIKLETVSEVEVVNMTKPLPIEIQDISKPKNITVPTVTKPQSTKSVVPLVTPQAPVVTKPQPTYYPAPVEIKDIIKNEVVNIVNEIIPPKTEADKKQEAKNITIEDKILGSIVNIYCSQTIGSQIRKTTGSGVVIDPSGVILTNAHVAEYFLLAQNNNNTNCFIRTDSPAVSSYKAKLVYISDTWIEHNKNNLAAQTLTGTGEDDYALIVITEIIRAGAPDAPLASLGISSANVTNGDDVFVAGYPAGFSDVRILDSGLYSLVKPTQITNVAGFDGVSPDVINTRSTSVAEHGSSGGAVTDTNGNLIALIAATNIDSQTGGKNIQAITLSYIKKSIKSNSGKSFESLISNAPAEAVLFQKNKVSLLANLLLGN